MRSNIVCAYLGGLQPASQALRTDILCNTLAMVSLLLASSQGIAAVDEHRIDEHIRVLASDAFEGRAPATAGEDKSLRYIAQQFRWAGLSPAGEASRGHRTWLQTVPVTRSDFSKTVNVTVSMNGVHQTWKQGTQIALRPTLVPTDHVSVMNVPLVFVGSDNPDPAKSGHDMAGVDVKGKIVVSLMTLPDKAMSAPHPLPSKSQQAVRQGALGELVVHEQSVVGYAWRTIANSFPQTRFGIEPDDPDDKQALIEGALEQSAAQAVIQVAGLDWNALRSKGRAPNFRPIELSGVTISIDYPVKVVDSVTHNVMGRIIGTGHPEETILYAAHWDHEGIGAADATGDPVYHGALDNASGVAVLIEMARELAHRPRPDRSIVFISFGVEEPGLFGSRYYARHPIYPLAKTAADMTLDIVYPWGKARDVGSHGYDDNTLNDFLIEAAKRQGRRFTPEAHPDMGFKYRSDQYPIARAGVPSILLDPGLDLVEGGLAAGEAHLEDYLLHAYHQQADRYHANWNVAGMAQNGDLLADVGYRLANSRNWPEWKSSSEFKPQRDATAAERR